MADNLNSSSPVKKEGEKTAQQAFDTFIDTQKGFYQFVLIPLFEQAKNKFESDSDTSVPTSPPITVMV